MGFITVAPNKRTNARKFPKMPGPRPDHAEAKRAEAIERAEERAKRSPEQQLRVLDAVFGIGQGAVKERKRLQAQLQAPPPPTAIAGRGKKR